MSNEDRAENAGRWAEGKSGLEKALHMGIHGAPELRKEEKEYYLGEFRERVMKVLTKRQMQDNEVINEIKETLLDPRAARIIIDGSVPDRHNDKYEKLAASMGKASTTRRDANFKGDVGLAVVSEQAVDFSDEQISVTTWTESMLQKGIPDRIIAAAGSKLCKACYELVREKAPEELGRYRQLSTLEKLMGMKCPAH